MAGDREHSEVVTATIQVADGGGREERLILTISQ
jgi:hypothetical protein